MALMSGKKWETGGTGEERGSKSKNGQASPEGSPVALGRREPETVPPLGTAYDWG